MKTNLYTASDVHFEDRAIFAFAAAVAAYEEENNIVAYIQKITNKPAELLKADPITGYCRCIIVRSPELGFTVVAGRGTVANLPGIDLLLGTVICPPAGVTIMASALMRTNIVDDIRLFIGSNYNHWEAVKHTEKFIANARLENLFISTDKYAMAGHSLYASVSPIFAARHKGWEAFCLDSPGHAHSNIERMKNEPFCDESKWHVLQGLPNPINTHGGIKQGNVWQMELSTDMKRNLLVEQLGFIELPNGKIYSLHAEMEFEVDEALSAFSTYPQVISALHSGIFNVDLLATGKGSVKQIRSVDVDIDIVSTNNVNKASFIPSAPTCLSVTGTSNDVPSIDFQLPDTRPTVRSVVDSMTPPLQSPAVTLNNLNLNITQPSQLPSEKKSNRPIPPSEPRWNIPMAMKVMLALGVQAHARAGVTEPAQVTEKNSSLLGKKIADDYKNYIHRQIQKDAEKARLEAPPSLPRPFDTGFMNGFNFRKNESGQDSVYYHFNHADSNNPHGMDIEAGVSYEAIYHLAKKAGEFLSRINYTDKQRDAYNLIKFMSKRKGTEVFYKEFEQRLQNSVLNESEKKYFRFVFWIAPEELDGLQSVFIENDNWKHNKIQSELNSLSYSLNPTEYQDFFKRFDKKNRDENLSLHCDILFSMLQPTEKADKTEKVTYENYKNLMYASDSSEIDKAIHILCKDSRENNFKRFIEPSLTKLLGDYKNAKPKNKDKAAKNFKDYVQKHGNDYSDEMADRQVEFFIIRGEEADLLKAREILSDKGKASKANEITHDLAQKYPNNKAYIEQSGIAHAKQGDVGNAALQWKKLDVLSRESTKHLYSLINKLEKGGKYLEAKELCEKFITSFSDPEENYNYAHCYVSLCFNSNDYLAGISQLEILMDNPYVLQDAEKYKETMGKRNFLAAKKAYSDAKAGHFDLAIEQIKKIAPTLTSSTDASIFEQDAQIYIDNIKVLLNNAIIHYQDMKDEKEHSKASELCKQYISIATTSDEIYKYSCWDAYLNFQPGKYKDAIEILEKLINVYQQDSEKYNELAEKLLSAYRAQAQEDKIPLSELKGEWLNKILTEDGFFNINTILGVLEFYCGQGDFDKAMDYFKQHQEKINAYNGPRNELKTFEFVLIACLHNAIDSENYNEVKRIEEEFCHVPQFFRARAICQEINDIRVQLVQCDSAQKLQLGSDIAFMMADRFEDNTLRKAAISIFAAIKGTATALVASSTEWLNFSREKYHLNRKLDLTTLTDIERDAYTQQLTDLQNSSFLAHSGTYHMLSSILMTGKRWHTAFIRDPLVKGAEPNYAELDSLIVFSDSTALYLDASALNVDWDHKISIASVALQATRLALDTLLAVDQLAEKWHGKNFGLKENVWIKTHFPESLRLAGSAVAIANDLNPVTAVVHGTSMLAPHAANYFKASLNPTITDRIQTGQYGTDNEYLSLAACVGGFQRASEQISSAAVIHTAVTTGKALASAAMGIPQVAGVVTAASNMAVAGGTIVATNVAAAGTIVATKAAVAGTLLTSTVTTIGTTTGITAGVTTAGTFIATNVTAAGTLLASTATTIGTTTGITAGATAVGTFIATNVAAAGTIVATNTAAVGTFMASTTVAVESAALINAAAPIIAANASALATSTWGVVVAVAPVVGGFILVVGIGTIGYNIYRYQYDMNTTQYCVNAYVAVNKGDLARVTQDFATYRNRSQPTESASLKDWYQWTYNGTVGLVFEGYSEDIQKRLAKQQEETHYKRISSLETEDLQERAYFHNEVHKELDAKSKELDEKSKGCVLSKIPAEKQSNDKSQNLYLKREEGRLYYQPCLSSDEIHEITLQDCIDSGMDKKQIESLFNKEDIDDFLAVLEPYKANLLAITFKKAPTALNESLLQLIEKIEQLNKKYPHLMGPKCDILKGYYANGDYKKVLSEADIFLNEIDQKFQAEMIERNRIDVDVNQESKKKNDAELEEKSGFRKGSHVSILHIKARTQLFHLGKDVVSARKTLEKAKKRLPENRTTHSLLAHVCMIDLDNLTQEQITTCEIAANNIKYLRPINELMDTITERKKQLREKRALEQELDEHMVHVKKYDIYFTSSIPEAFYDRIFFFYLKDEKLYYSGKDVENNEIKDIPFDNLALSVEMKQRILAAAKDKTLNDIFKQQEVRDAILKATAEKKHTDPIPTVAENTESKQEEKDVALESWGIQVTARPYREFECYTQTAKILIDGLFLINKWMMKTLESQDLLLIAQLPSEIKPNTFVLTPNGLFEPNEEGTAYDSLPIITPAELEQLGFSIADLSKQTYSVGKSGKLFNSTQLLSEALLQKLSETIVDKRMNTQSHNILMILSNSIHFFLSVIQFQIFFFNRQIELLSKETEQSRQNYLFQVHQSGAAISSAFLKMCKSASTLMPESTHKYWKNIDEIWEKYISPCLQLAMTIGTTWVNRFAVDPATGKLLDSKVLDPMKIMEGIFLLSFESLLPTALALLNPSPKNHEQFDWRFFVAKFLEKLGGQKGILSVFLLDRTHFKNFNSWTSEPISYIRNIQSTLLVWEDYIDRNFIKIKMLNSFFTYAAELKALSSFYRNFVLAQRILMILMTLGDTMINYRYDLLCYLREQASKNKEFANTIYYQGMIAENDKNWTTACQCYLEANGFHLCLMSEIGKNGLSPNKLYLEIKDDQIQYRTNLTLNTDPVMLEGDLSLKDGELYKAISAKKLAEISLSSLKALFDEVLKKDHIKINCPAAQERLKILDEMGKLCLKNVAAIKNQAIINQPAEDITMSRAVILFASVGILAQPPIGGVLFLGSIISFFVNKESITLRKFSDQLTNVGIFRLWDSVSIADKQRRLLTNVPSESFKSTF